MTKKTSSDTTVRNYIDLTLQEIFPEGTDCLLNKELIELKKEIEDYLSEPVAGFGGRTAKEIIKDGEGDALKSHVLRRFEGGYA